MAYLKRDTIVLINKHLQKKIIFNSRDDKSSSGKFQIYKAALLIYLRFCLIANNMFFI